MSTTGWSRRSSKPAALAAIAASHPHMFGVQVEWSHRFGDVPVYVVDEDRQWLQRADRVVQTWSEAIEVLPGIALYRIGGHFPAARSPGTPAPTVEACCSPATPSPARRTSTGSPSCAVSRTSCRCRRRWWRRWPAGSSPWTSTGSTTTSPEGGRRRPDLGTPLGRPLHRLGPRRLRRIDVARGTSPPGAPAPRRSHTGARRDSAHQNGRSPAATRASRRASEQVSPGPDSPSETAPTKRSDARATAGCSLVKMGSMRRASIPLRALLACWILLLSQLPALPA